MGQQENLNKLLFLFSTLKLALNHSCHYTNLFLSNNVLCLWNLKKKTNVFRICLSSLYPFTDWLKTHLDSRVNKWVFVLLDSVRLSLKSKTTHSTCLACIHNLMRSPCPYINLRVIDMALLEQVSNSQLESELSGGNNVTLDFFFAVL